MIIDRIIIALIVLLGGAACYVACVCRKEEREFLRNSHEGGSMSWFTQIEGDVKTVAEKIVAEAERVEGKIAKAVKAAEKSVVGEIEKLIGEAGLDIKDVRVKVESNGHFNSDGTGSAVITINSTPAPVAAPAPEVAPAPETPPAAEAPKEGAEQ